MGGNEMRREEMEERESKEMDWEGKL